MKKRLFTASVVLSIVMFLTAVPHEALSAQSDYPTAPHSTPAQAEKVAFNVRTHKYHCLTCYYAKRCTANCVELTLKDAVARGGVACKICGGHCER